MNIGIFWLVQSSDGHQHLVAHLCPAPNWESYDGFDTCPHGHFQKWSGWQRRPSFLPPLVRAVLTSSEYEEWPRGRLVKQGTEIVVYADRQLHNPVYMEAIERAFELTGSRFSFRTDTHYRLARKLSNAAFAINIARAP